MSNNTGDAARADAVVVYSCVAKSYDKALMDVRSNDQLRFVVFTDDAKGLHAPGWEVRSIVSPSRLTSGHDVNRFHKFFPHRIFPDTRWSIYIDGNVTYKGDFLALVAGMEGSAAAVGGFWHPKGNTLREEVEANRAWRFDQRDFDRIGAQLEAYERAGIQLERKIPTNQMLVRDHHAHGLENAMSIWWSQLFEFTRRDQISLLYALQQAGADWFALASIEGVSYDLVHRVKHRDTIGKRIKNQIRQRLDIPLT